MYIRGRNDTPSSTQPIAILLTLEGSFRRIDCHPQSAFSIGVNSLQVVREWGNDP
jgi:hypothetical protein